MYLQDYDDRFPPMEDVARLKDITRPYIKHDEIWTVPPYKIPYAVNPSLSRKLLGKIGVPAEMVTIYEPIAGQSYRIVGFADGHVKAIPEAQWPALREKSGIPALPEVALAPWWRFDVKGPRKLLNLSTTFGFLLYLGWGLVLVAAFLRLRYGPVTFWQGAGEVLLATIAYLVLTSILGFMLGLFLFSHR
jgi:prepilin-type processing-associated H-X9-DG protein